MNCMVTHDLPAPPGPTTTCENVRCVWQQVHTYSGHVQCCTNQASSDESAAIRGLSDQHVKTEPKVHAIALKPRALRASTTPKKQTAGCRRRRYGASYHTVHARYTPVRRGAAGRRSTAPTKCCSVTLRSEATPGRRQELEGGTF